VLGVWIAIAMCNQRATDLQNASTRAQCEASRIGGFRALTDIEVRIATELKKYSRMISRTFCLSMHCGFERPPKLATHPSIQCGLGRGNGRVCLKHVARGSMKLGCYGGRWTPRCWTTRRLPATHRSRWDKWFFSYAAYSQWCPQDKIWNQRSLPLGTLTGSLQQSWGFLWWLINITGTPTH